MKINFLNSTYKVINVLVVTIIAICLNYSTIFWIGSKEQYDELKAKSFLLLFFNRFILNTFVIVFLLLIFLIISRILGKKIREGLTLKKVFFMDLLILAVISTLFILVRNI
jgi:nitrogen fixation-related uncharacterized protein